MKLVVGRRGFLAGAASLILMSASAHAAQGLRRPARPRLLKLHNLQTGESLSEVYWADGEYLPQCMARIDWLLRDHHRGETRMIDHKLLDLLHNVSRKLDYNGTVEVVSAYRSAATNQKLAEKGRGVAPNSLHTQGMAVDIRIPKRNLAQVRDAAMQVGGGGVGFYRRAKFIHLDTGRVRYW
jgi:uncharacterized protein YcbK (DUF882 family)